MDNEYAAVDELYPAIADVVDDIVLAFAIDSLRYVYANQRACVLLGYEQKDWLGMTPMDVIEGMDELSFRDLMASLLDGSQQQMALDTIYVSRAGRHVHVSIHWHVVAGSCQSWVVAIARDITPWMSLHDRIRSLHRYDAVSGLCNRQALADMFGQYCRRTECFHLARVCLSKLPVVRRVLGDRVGDRMVVAVAGMLRNMTIRHRGVQLASVDDGVFVLLVPESDAPALLQRVRSRFDRALKLDHYLLDLHAFVGVACYPRDGHDFDALMRHARSALDTARHAHVPVHYFSMRDSSREAVQLGMIEHMRQGIRQHEFQLVYQPKVGLDSGRVDGVEALLRWHSSVLGDMSPDRFIPVAEETGYIIELTRHVLDMAVEQCRRWQQQGRPMTVAVNVSAQSLQDTAFVDQVLGTLKHWDVQTNLLMLEITESTVMEDPQCAMQVLCRLFRQGVSFSVDDFGTGYSSLAYLSRLPLQELKVDRAFVMRMAESDRDAAIVQATIDLAHRLGFTVTAEGAENAVALQMLETMHCDKVQGYVFARPMSIVELERWLKQREGVKKAVGDPAVF